jgi:quercetin dioxygenase-like cupin family protein
MDTQSFVTLSGRELVWNMAPGRTAALKLLNEQTGGSVMAFEETTPAGTETQLHLHHDSDEVMFVLSGEFSFKVGDQFGTGRPGSCVFIPRGVPHAWKNRHRPTSVAVGSTPIR